MTYAILEKICRNGGNRMKKEWVEKFYSDGLLPEPYKEWQLDMLNSDAPVELFQYRSDEEINVTNLEKEVI